jgi:uncharacterized repeat protein (TIGR01451 family)/fimbrial isopeptide formation D2 family protein
MAIQSPSSSHQAQIYLSTRRKLIFWLLAAWFVTFLLLLGLPKGHSAPETGAMPSPSPVPVVTLNVPNEVMIGEDFTFEVKFDNSAGPVGYGPYIEVYLPVKGADSNAAGLKCDGISFQSTVTPFSVFTNPPTVAIPPTYTSTLSGSASNLNCANPYTLPFTGMTPALPAVSGDFQLIVLELPFGSFDATQREVTVKVTAHLSDYADLNTPLTIFARGGFRYGSDPLDNPTQDQLIESAIASAQTTPTVLKISKAYIGPEGETVTGPNYPRKYTITADIADTQPINDLVIKDTLPANLQYIGNLQVKIKGSPANIVTSCSTTPGLLDVVVSPPLPGPGGILSVKFCSPITGSVAPDDVSITFDFFIPDRDANGKLIIQKDCSNAPVAVENDISATGNWDPLDPRDAAVGATIPVDTDLFKVDNVFQAKCLAIQKSTVTIVQQNPGGGSGFTPGDTLEYELEVQISDYFTIGKLMVKDYLGDGQDYLSGPTSTLTVSDQFGSKTGSFPLTTVTASKDEPGAEKFCSPSRPPQGGIVLTFDVSTAMGLIMPLPLRPRLTAGILTGGLAAGSPLMAPAIGKIKFRTKIRDEFRFVSNIISPKDKYVDKHDPINNCVLIEGSVYDNVNRPAPINAPLNIPSTIIGNANDTSKKDVTIQADKLEKSVYAVKRGTTFVCGPTTTPCAVPPAAPEVQPGDQVTYRIKKMLPSGDGEDVTIRDWLPLPIFNVAAGMTFNNTACTGVPAIPATGNGCLGPTDTIHSLVSSATPSFVPDPATNSFSFNYGDFNDPTNQVNYIDLLFTTTVTNVPFADGLFLTNDTLECEGTTFSTAADICQRSIAQVKVREPKLSITKGVVATDNSHGEFKPALSPAGVWKPFGTSCPAFNPNITSSNLPGLVNSDLSNVDAGDSVTFAIAIENSGGSPAYNVELADIIPLGPTDLPSCFGPNSPFCVTDGHGTLIPFTTAPGGFGRTIIKLGTPLDPLNSSTAATGTNIAVITFNAKLLDKDRLKAGCCHNITQLIRYTSTPQLSHQPIPPNFVDAGFGGPFQDTANICVGPKAFSKCIVKTSELHTKPQTAPPGAAPVAIGEIIRYRIAATVPEGLSPNFQIRDVLPPGLTYLGSPTVGFVSTTLGSITSTTLSGAGLNFSGSEQTVNCAPVPTPALTLALTSGVTVISGSGGDVTFSLGDIKNAESDTDLEFVVMEFNALVDNVTGNVNGTTLTNTFDFTVDGKPFDENNAISVNATVVEPNLVLTKTVAPNPALTGQTLTYTVKYTNNGTADAFDVELKDTLPAGLTFGTITAGCPVTNATSNAVTVTCAQVPIAPNPGSTVIITYQAVANPATCPVTLENRAKLTWTSLPGPQGTTGNPTGSNTPGNSGAVNGERDGVTAPLTLNNYAATASAAVKIDCPCCLQVSNEKLACNSNGSFNYTFTLTNLTGATIAGMGVVNFSPASNVTITPSSVTIPPLAAGASTTVTVTIGGPGAVSGATVCFGIALGGPATPSCTVQHCITLPTCPIACATQPSNMVGWWPLDEPSGATVVNDIAGFNNQGIPKPGGQVGIGGPASVIGEVLGALYFTGPYVEVAPQAELDFGPGDFSIDAWVKPVDCSHGGGGVLSPIVDKFDGTTGFSFYLNQPTVGAAYLYLNINGSTFVSSGTNGTIPTLSSALWTHVAVTVAHPLSASAVGTFYINGSAAGTFTPPPGSVTNTLPMWIGKTRIAGGVCETAIDELELFNRALLPAEIKSIADAKTAGKCKCSLESKETISCNPNGTFSYTFNLTNLTASTVTGVSFASSGVTITPNVMPISLAAGASTTVTVTISGAGAVSGATVCFTVGLVGPPPANDCRADHCVTLPNCSVGCAPRPPGMVAWWPMNVQNGNVNDIAPPPDSMVNNVGGSPAYQPVFGNVGGASGALFFGGPPVQVSPQVPLELDFGTGDFSIDAWVRIVSVAPGVISPIVDKFTMPGGPGFAFYVKNQRLELNINGTTFVSTGPLMLFANPVANTGPWYHVAVTVQRSPAQLKFYINAGVPAGTFTAVPATSVSNGLPLWIGGTRLLPGAVRGGIAIDELELFNRVLTQAQIQSIVNAGSAGKCP